MQLKYVWLLAACSMATAAMAQGTAKDPKFFQQVSPADVNILASYYTQDGDHSPVTGGIGTEQLTDVTPTIIVNVPLDTVTSLHVNFGMDFYSSASTDNIDPFEVSSASSSDTRTHINIGLSRNNNLHHVIRSINIGASKEYDYTSFSVGAGWTKGSRDGNRELSLAGEIFMDAIKVIYPIELRGQGDLVSANKRQSYNFSATLSQVINQRLQLSFSSDLVYQTGLLSTTFHRVYFQDQEKPQVEQLPANRFKFPFGLRLNYYAGDYLTARLFYRFYNDSWGISSHTLELETPIKIGPFFSIYPFYRFYTQTGANYFAPYGRHLLSEEFYTSDYDLSDLNSHKAGLGVRYSPLFGISKFNMPISGNSTLFKSIELRAAQYWRNDGLHAFIISTDLGFSIPSGQ
ncbi:DUF3570 domain-containing protein [Pontibacter sp. 172403-2]|uniref:DUF3570 domain-containing protein n=1 Tax=Pontibacter rufus TaxID=2791028 RepID=UPI0018AFA5B7|nr:DUF3570 domain-containing protein [Pontibacter sp. 172403-2]MBF9253696.1 DUF3570 domain-containing protein [Pontibacter sp. 172403-2]